MIFRTALFASVAAVAACLAAPAARADETADLVAKGRAQMRKGDWAAAADTLKAAVAKGPSDVEARRWYADCLLGLGRPDDALEQASQGLDLVKDADAGLWTLLARAYLQKAEAPGAPRDQAASDFADAKAKAAKAVSLDPGLVPARSTLARACRLTDETDRALATLDEGLARAPEDFDLLFERGMVCLRRKEYGPALAAFDGAAKADPKSVEAEFERAMALAFLRRMDDCYSTLVKAAAMDPGNLRPARTIFDWLKERSVPRLREVVKARPDHSWARAYLAFWLAKATPRDEAGALGEMRTALSQRPQDADLVAWQGTVLDALGKAEEAQAAWKKSLEMAKGNRGPIAKDAFMRLYALCLDPRSSVLSPGDKKDLVEYLSKAGTDNGDFWNDVGLYHRDTTKDIRKALDAYLKAAALLPEDQGVQNDTGLIYLYNGKQIGEDRRKALPFFEQCLSLVEERGQVPKMGYRDTLQNLAQYYMDVEPNPEKALLYAEKRNDPEFLATVEDPKDRTPWPGAAAVRAWAERQLKK